MRDLHRVEGLPFSQPFNRFNLRSNQITRCLKAGSARLTIDDHCAGATLTQATSEFCADQAKALS